MININDLKDSKSIKFHENGDLLRQVMKSQGFCRLPTEWWYFSFSDQVWTANENLKNNTNIKAIYGKID